MFQFITETSFQLHVEVKTTKRKTQKKYTENFKNESKKELL